MQRTRRSSDFFVADRDARSEQDEKLSNLIAQLEETNRSLHAESLPNDRVLSDIAFSYAQTLDHLRSTVALFAHLGATFRPHQPIAS